MKARVIGTQATRGEMMQSIDREVRSLHHISLISDVPKADLCCNPDLSLFCCVL